MNCKKYRGYIVTALIILIVGIIILVSLAGYKFSKSREYQFGGGLIHRIDTKEKIVALTFDDGPTSKTEEILNMLDELEVQATFFLTGKEIEENKEYAHAIVQRGHQVGNHSYSHPRMMFKSKNFIREEIEQTNNLIREVGYEGEIFFRAPYCKKLFALPIVLKEKEMHHITWDVEPDTYLGVDTSPEEYAEYILDNVREGSIILMHPMNNANTIKALPLIINGLHQQGYKFVTISELLEYR